MSILNKHGQNLLGRDFIVGDMHGCYQEFIDCLLAVNFDPWADRCFSVGDLIDRGPDSLSCLELIEKPWFFPVLGNHEDLAYKAINGGFRENSLWCQNGGDWMSDLDERAFERARALIQATAHLPLAIEVKVAGGRIGVTHADCPHDWNDISIKGEGLKHSLIWSRAKALSPAEATSTVVGIDLVFHGHTPEDTVTYKHNSVFIDTGCVYGNNLTLIRIDNLLEVK